jgi:D-sedoheptulose 7-phosphate isomerase
LNNPSRKAFNDKEENMNAALWENVIVESIEQNIKAKEKLLEAVPFIVKMAHVFVQTLLQGGTIFFFGNGGSAADAQHLAAELVGRFAENRRGFPAIALTVNTSNLTAIGNDFGYEKIFSRQLEALFKKEDLAVGISTSGNSPNVLEGIKTAKAIGGTTLGFTGGDGGKLKDLVDYAFIAPAKTPARIQEIHILVGHILCHIAELEMIKFSNKKGVLLEQGKDNP